MLDFNTLNILNELSKSELTREVRDIKSINASFTSTIGKGLDRHRIE